MGKITKETIIQDIFINHPEKASNIADFLKEKGVACVGCCSSSFETIEEGLKGHGIEEKEITQIIEKINDIIKK